MRQWRLIILLRRRAWTIEELAEELDVCCRTIYRDLDALQMVPFPITTTERNKHQRGRWSLGPMVEWPRNEAAPVRELRA